MYRVNVLHFHHMYNQLILLNFDEMIFLHLIIFFIGCFIIDTNTCLCISIFFQSNECIKGNFGMNAETRRAWIFNNIIDFWCIQIIWLATVDVCVNSSTYPLIINVKNIPSLFPAWWLKHYSAPIQPKLNFKIEKTFNVMSIDIWLIVW